MELHYYKGKDLEEVISNKYEDFEKHTIGCPVWVDSEKQESGVKYKWDDFLYFELAKPNRNQEVFEFVGRAYDTILLNFDCDGCSYVRKGEAFDELTKYTYGFFLVKDGVITEFITEDFIRGYLKCLDNFSQKVSSTFADIMKQMGAV